MSAIDQIREQAEKALREKYAALTSEWAEVISDISKMEARLKAIRQEISDCEAAARVFGVRVTFMGPPEANEPKLDLTGASLDRGTVVKTVVEQQLELAHPNY